MSRLIKEYKENIVPSLMKDFGYKNKFQTPQLTKIVLNMGVGEGAADIKVLEQAIAEMTVICGQKPVITRAKQSVAGFKLRKGSPIGCKVTLRSKMMYEFLDRLINVVLPRIRDFRGVNPDSFDKGGNYALGLSEQTIFPEINVDKVTKTTGMDVVIVTTAHTADESRALLKYFGMPFRQK